MESSRLERGCHVFLAANDDHLFPGFPGSLPQMRWCPALERGPGPGNNTAAGGGGVLNVPDCTSGTEPPVDHQNPVHCVFVSDPFFGCSVLCRYVRQIG